MTHLDERGLEAAFKAAPDDWNCRKSHLQVIETAIRTYLSALPYSPVSELVEKWRKAMEGVTPGPWETTGGSVTDFGREWPGSLSMEFIPNGYDEEINVRHKADAAWMARCSPDRIDALITTISTRNADLEREVKRLREALEFYADTSKYPAPFTGGFGELYYDCGQIARTALSTSPQGGEHE